jgi:hypothetical protein
LPLSFSLTGLLSQMTEENPYVAKSLSHSSMPKRARWLRRFAVLNGFLIAVPLAIVGMLYLALTWNTPKASWQLSGSSGSLGLGTVVVLSAYFVVPNLFLSSCFFWARRSKDRP